MHMVEGAGGAWRRKLASGAGRAWVAALVEGARLDGDVGGGSWTEQRPVTSGAGRARVAVRGGWWHVGPRQTARGDAVLGMPPAAVAAGQSSWGGR
jgi:hypothetical protein